MIGPTKKKMPDRDVCEECDAVISKTIDGTRLYQKKRVVNYCTYHPSGISHVGYLNDYPYTPKWCRAE